MGISKWNAGIIRPVPVAPAGPYETGAAPGVWTLDQVAYWQKQGLWPLAGNTQNFIEDMFSTWLYTGNGTTQTITNGVNLSGKGGLVWTKTRTIAGSDHILVDTARGVNKYLISNTTGAQDSAGPLSVLPTFTSTGYTVSDYNNQSTQPYVGWTFRKQPKFFDVVTYTGTGVARTVSHNLGATPGCIIIKRTDVAGNAWYVYHRSLGATKVIYLNQTDAAATVTSPWNDTEPTSTEFTVGANNNDNASGGTFVAYLFAHNAGGFGLTGTDNVVSCGSFTANANTTVNLGFEPQWILLKNASGAFNWGIFDAMRGWTTDGNIANLKPNLSDSETQESAIIKPTATGFQWIPAVSGNTYIYIAVRRGPMKVPTLGTSVFSVDTTTADSAITSTLKQTDMGWFKDRTTVANWFVADRLRGFTNAYYTPTLYTNLTNAEATPTTGDTVTAFGPTTTGVNNGVIYAGGAGVAGNYPLLYSFKRAPGFFDEVCYTGNGTNSQTFTHNLGVAPELVIVKCRSSATAWESLGTALSASQRQIYLNRNAAGVAVGIGHLGWNGTDNAYKPPTSSLVYFGSDSDSGGNALNYVAYLFATVAGVSKVGIYTGTGALQTVACGFTTGTRFVLIKRTDATGDWYVWDSARGISSGTDPYLLLNSTAAEVTVNNYVDTDVTGFKVTAAAPAALNASGGTYIFLAIA